MPAKCGVVGEGKLIEAETTVIRLEAELRGIEQAEELAHENTPMEPEEWVRVEALNEAYMEIASKDEMIATLKGELVEAEGKIEQLRKSERGGESDEEELRECQYQLSCQVFCSILIVF